MATAGLEATRADADAGRLRRENDHLRFRVAQLQGEVWDLSGRLAQALMLPERAAPFSPRAGAGPKGDAAAPRTSTPNDRRTSHDEGNQRQAEKSWPAQAERLATQPETPGRDTGKVQVTAGLPAVGAARDTRSDDFPKGADLWP